MTRRRRFTPRERRARLVARHHLGRTAADVASAVRDVVAVHSSDPVAPYLALRARVSSFRVEDLDRALYTDRSLWRLHGMRRTLFVVHACDAATVHGACSREVARTERRKLERWVAEALGLDDARSWLQAVEAETLAALADGTPRRTQELTSLVDGLSLGITVGSGKWTAHAPLSSRLLFLLALDGHVVRARPAGSWLSSQYRWVRAASWFGEATSAAEVLEPEEARAVLARRWLGAYGPATTADLQWWAGWTRRATEAALAAIAAVAVELDGGQAAWVLGDDLDHPADDGGAQTVALLPALDATAMGWKEREWYLAEHGPRLFDRNGNAGPTVWVDGRVAGGWAQRRTGEVVTALLEDVGTEAVDAVAAEAAALAEWCDGVVATPRFRTPLERQLST